MNRQSISFITGLTAWLFAFSMLSNCYCNPTSASPAHPGQQGMQTKMTHCQQQAANSKAASQNDSDCAPRYSTDQFEIAFAIQTNFTPQVFNFQQATSFSELSSQSPAFGQIKVSHDVPGVSPPVFYLLHHTFLI